MEEPNQIEHTPEIQAFLDQLEALTGVGEAAEDQTTKNPDCTLQAGSIKCLNAASYLCERCSWWAGFAEEEESFPF